MRSRFLILAAALTFGLAASFAAAGAPPAERSGLAKCVKAWNKGSNSEAQQKLAAYFDDGDKGNVIVGSKKGRCLLAAYNTSKPKYVIYKRSGNAFARAGGGPADEYAEFRDSIDYVDVILQPSGDVEPV